MEKITEQQYKDALALVADYIVQEKHEQVTGLIGTRYDKGYSDILRPEFDILIKEKR